MTAHQQLPPKSTALDRTPPRTKRLTGGAAGARRQKAQLNRPPAWRRVCVGFVAMIVMPIAILLLLAAGVGYFRLQQGPVLVNFLAASVKQGIDQGLPGLSASFDDVILTVADTGGLELRLRNLSLSEVGGDIVVVAPQAAIELHHGSLWSMHASPQRIELIEPRISLLYSRQSGFALSFSSEASIDPDMMPGQTPEAGVIARTGGAIDVAALARSTASYAAQVGSGSSTLREVGLRNATLLLDAEGRKTYWQVPRLLVDVEQKDGSNIVSGSARVSSSGRIWAASFRTEEKTAGGTLSVSASFDDVVPKEIAWALPGIDALEMLDTPMSAQVKADFSRNGELLAGALDVDVSGSRIRLRQMDRPLVEIDTGVLRLAYEPSAQRFAIQPSRIGVGQHGYVVNGEAVNESGGDGGAIWAFSGRMTPTSEEVGATTRVAIQSAQVSGRFVADEEKVQVDEVKLALAGGHIGLHGELDLGDNGGAKWDGDFSGMPVRHLSAVWPKAIASGGRQWFRNNVTDGQVESGTISYLSGRHLEAQGDVKQNPAQLVIAMEVKDVVFTALTGFPSLSAERAVSRFENDKLELDLPAAAMDLGDGDVISIQDGKFVGSDMMGAAPSGQVTFKFSGPAGAVEKLAEAPGLSGPLVAKERVPKGVSGKINGDATVGFPLGATLTQREIGYDITANFTEGKVPGLLDGHDIKGASLEFHATPQAIDAKGEFLVKGVLAKLNWQWIVGADRGRQRPMRITALLDAADRRQLGIALDETVLGDVPVVLTVERPGQDDQDVHVRADLTSAALSLGMIGWKKPAGRRAFMEFNVATNGDAKGRSLSNFRITGSDIAIEGKVGLDAKGGARSFDFPRFSLDLVSRLSASGKRRENGVWSLKLAGKTYQGRTFFRSLFSVGRDKGGNRGKKSAGFDVVANIENVLGFDDVALRKAKLIMSSRRGQLTALEGRGVLDGGKPMVFELRGKSRSGGSRRLLVDTSDAGKAFKLVGFYPNMVGGRLRLEIDLDGSGAAEKTGTLWVDTFKVLGDPVISEVVGSADESVPAIARKRRVVRQVFEFDSLRAPFSVGHGQIVVHDAALHGALLGATLRGKVDFTSKTVDLGGTYVFLQGLNNAFAAIPLLGELLSGPRKEGIFGTNYAIRGPMARPQVFVHPLSSIAPGIFREIFQLAPQSQSVSPRSQLGGVGAGRRPLDRRGKTGGKIIDGWGTQLDTD